MRRRSVINYTAYGLLVASTAIMLSLPESLVMPSSSAQVPPSTALLHGVVRDFRPTHVDFDVPVTGHVAGNIGFALDDRDRPVFAGGGAAVATQWRDASNRPIPSHLYGDGVSPRLAVSGRFDLSGSCFVDGFDSRNGAYGGANVNNGAVLSVDTTVAGSVALTGTSQFRGDVLVGQGGNPASVIAGVSHVTGNTGALPQPVELPTIELPTDVGPYLGPQNFDGVTVHVDSNRHWGDTRAEGTLFEISGERTILVDGYLDIDDTVNDFVFLPGATLKLYCTSWMEIDNDARLNMNTGEPSRLTIYMTGTYDGAGDEEETGLLDVEDGAQITADIVAPNGKLLLDNGCDVFGTFVGEAVEIGDNSRFHVDLAVFASGCASADGTPGVTGSAGTGGIDSPDSFGQWFRDSLGMNLAARHDITLTADAFGVYEYLDDAFYPIDNELLDDDTHFHNNFFTYQIDATFTYQACTGQFFEFEGGDGAWLFVDGRLVMDLGGVEPGVRQYVEMDRLGLADGGEHRLQLFYAHRNSLDSVFRLRTNVELVSRDIPFSVTAAFD